MSELSKITQTLMEGDGDTLIHEKKEVKLCQS